MKTLVDIAYNKPIDCRDNGVKIKIRQSYHYTNTNHNKKTMKYRNIAIENINKIVNHNNIKIKYNNK